MIGKGWWTDIQYSSFWVDQNPTYFWLLLLQKKTHFSFIVIVWESRFTFCDFLSPFHMLVASQSNLSALVLGTTLLLKSGKRVPEGRVTTTYTLLVRKTKAFPKASRLLRTPHRALTLGPAPHVHHYSISVHLWSTALPVLLVAGFLRHIPASLPQEYLICHGRHWVTIKQWGRRRE